MLNNFNAVHDNDLVFSQEYHVNKNDEWRHYTLQKNSKNI